MDETNNQEKIVTAQEVEAIIDHTKYGEYDQYHEWNPSFSVEDKAVYLDKMMADWNRTEQGGKELIIQFIKTLLKDSGNNSVDVANILVRYAGIPEITRLVNGLLSSGYLCNIILIAMKNNQVRHEEWLNKIREVYTSKKFSEKQKMRKYYYQNIQDLLAELG